MFAPLPYHTDLFPSEILLRSTSPRKHSRTTPLLPILVSDPILPVSFHEPREFHISRRELIISTNLAL